MNKGKFQVSKLKPILLRLRLSDIQTYRNYIYGFILMARGGTMEFYHHSKDHVERWIEELKDCVFLVDLKEDYVIS